MTVSGCFRLLYHGRNNIPPPWSYRLTITVYTLWLPGRVQKVEGSDSTITVATDAAHVYARFVPYNPRLLLTFLALSVIAHLLLLMWPSPLSGPPLTAEQKYPPLHIQLETAPPERITQRHKAPSRKQVTRAPPPTAPITPTHRKSKSAEEVIDEAYKAAPGIVKQLESKQSGPEATTIFDPALRARLEQARRNQAHEEALLRAIAKQPGIELLAKTDNYLKVRIHGQCWRVPVSRGYDPFDVRIMAVDTNCPKPKSKLSDKQSKEIPLP